RPPTGRGPARRGAPRPAGRAPTPGRTPCSVRHFRIFAVGWSGQVWPVYSRDGTENSQSRTEHPNTVIRRRRPAACERLITPPAPCTGEEGAPPFLSAST